MWRDLVQILGCQRLEFSIPKEIRELKTLVRLKNEMFKYLMNMDAVIRTLITDILHYNAMCSLIYALLLCYYIYTCYTVITD
jgi:hypothetical protein